MKNVGFIVDEFRDGHLVFFIIFREGKNARVHKAGERMCVRAQKEEITENYQRFVQKLLNEQARTH